MTTRRGKYWVSDPARLEKANAKRERRKLRNLRLLWSIRRYTYKPDGPNYALIVD